MPEAARFVEPPILAALVSGVAVALDGVIARAGRWGRHFQDEVRRLAHFAHDVAVARDDSVRVFHAERHYEVRGEGLIFVVRVVAQVSFAGDEDVVAVGEVGF